jgi:hypothetical protein
VTDLFNRACLLKGTVGLALYQDDTFVSYLSGNPQSTDLDIGYGWSRISLKGSVPASITPGNYQLYVITRNTGEPAPSKIRGKKGSYPFYNVEVTDAAIVLTNGGNIPELSQLAPAELIGEAVVGADVTFTLQIKNDGAAYEDDFGLYIRKDGALRPFTRLTNLMTILPNTTSTVTVSGKLQDLPAGKYLAVGTYKENGEWKQFGNDMRMTFTLQATPTGIAPPDTFEHLTARSTATGLSISANSNLSAPIEVFTLQGVKVAQFESHASTIELALPQQGVYIVRQGTEVVKVLYKQ